MRRASAGYTPFMAAVNQRLKKIGLPGNVFDADFKAKEEANKLAAAAMLERLREKERNGEYEGLELPWTELRQQYEQDAAEGKTEDYLATQAVVPHWKKSLDITAYVWKSEVRQAIERQKNKNKKRE